jgi:hypothetical protein
MPVQDRHRQPSQQAAPGGLTRPVQTGICAWLHGDAKDGQRHGRSIRRAAFPHRQPSLSGFFWSSGGANGHHPPQPSGGRALDVLYGAFPANAARLNLSCAARGCAPRTSQEPSRTACPAPATTDGATKRRYLAFLGRISREKRLDRAIAIARAAGLPLKVAAKVGRAMTTTSERTSHLCSPSPGWGSSAKSTSGKRRGSWVTPGDSCFPLIGRNHSDWS